MAEAITIVILGSISGLKNASQIHQWAIDDRVSGLLVECKRQPVMFKAGHCRLHWGYSTAGTMDRTSQTEKNRERIEKRSACVTEGTGFLRGREEWAVETMYWFLEVHFEEDECRIEDRNIQQNLNMRRKAALHLTKQYKERGAV